MVNNMKDKKSNKTDNVVYMGGSEEALKIIKRRLTGHENKKA